MVRGGIKEIFSSNCGWRRPLCAILLWRRLKSTSPGRHHFGVMIIPARWHWSAKKERPDRRLCGLQRFDAVLSWSRRMFWGREEASIGQWSLGRVWVGVIKVVKTFHCQLTIIGGLVWLIGDDQRGVVLQEPYSLTCGRPKKWSWDSEMKEAHGWISCLNTFHIVQLRLVL